MLQTYYRLGQRHALRKLGAIETRESSNYGAPEVDTDEHDRPMPRTFGPTHTQGQSRRDAQEATDLVFDSHDAASAPKTPDGYPG